MTPKTHNLLSIGKTIAVILSDGEFEGRAKDLLRVGLCGYPKEASHTLVGADMQRSPSVSVSVPADLIAPLCAIEKKCT